MPDDGRICEGCTVTWACHSFCINFGKIVRQKAACAPLVARLLYRKPCRAKAM